MESRTQIPLSLGPAALLVRVHVAPALDDAAAVTALLDQARAVAHQKAPYADAFVEGRGADTLRTAGITFTGWIGAGHRFLVRERRPGIRGCILE